MIWRACSSTLAAASSSTMAWRWSSQRRRHMSAWKAAALGLTCQSLWVQVEQLIWGFKNDQMDAFLEICFCCPCCCVGMNLSKNGPRNIKRGFIPSGWTAVVDHDRCTGCGHCLDSYCPQDAIHFRESDGKMVVNQRSLPWMRVLPFDAAPKARYPSSRRCPCSTVCRITFSSKPSSRLFRAYTANSHGQLERAVLRGAASGCARRSASARLR